MRRKYHLDDDAFMLLNDNNCYWAGFLAADGSIIDDGRRVSVDVQKQDKQQLGNLKTWLQFEGPIREKRHSYRLECTSPLLCDTLTYGFNITSQKSLTLLPPSLRSESQILSFIRGYMDGDGSIWYEYNKGYNARQWRLSFIGTEQMLSWIKASIRSYVPEAGNPSVRHVKHDSKICQLVFGGQQVIGILNWLYSNSTDTTRLSRKYDRYQEAYCGSVS